MISRRMLLGAGLAAGALPSRLLAQGEPLRLGVLTPLTGAGAFDGPRMLKAIRSVVDEVNAGGGLLGRRIELQVEDDQTNPDAAVRAARKLIDIDKIPVIMGTWASAVTTAVAPLCWESKTFLTTVSGADSITRLPHQGYILRTQPNNHLQAGKHAEYLLSLGKKRVFVMSIQAPFAQPTQDRVAEVLKANGAEMVGALIYEKDKPTYRTEIDQAMRTKPDVMYLNGYAPDVTIVVRDLFRAGYDGLRFTQSYAMTSKVLEGLPPEVTEGIQTVQPSADINSPAFALATKRLGNEPDSYEAQATDWISVVVLGIAKAGQATGEGIRNVSRRITQGSGEKVFSAADGLRLIKEGKEINYEGVSGPCDFNDIGDILDCKFRYQQVEKGQLKFLKVV